MLVCMTHSQAIEVVSWNSVTLQSLGNCSPVNPSLFNFNSTIIITNHDSGTTDYSNTYLIDSNNYILSSIYSPISDPIGSIWGVVGPGETLVSPAPGPFRFVIRDTTVSGTLASVGDVFDPVGHPEVPAQNIFTFNPWELGAPCSPAVPVAGELSSVSGPWGGGNAVTIIGEEFYNSTSVLIDGVPVDPASVTVVSHTQVDVVMPVSPLPDGGGVQIEVSTVGGTSGPLVYTYGGPGVLSVPDAAEWRASGPEGGPFSPASKVWRLENTGADDIDVEVIATGNFFDISEAAPFTLAPGATRDVTAIFNAQALTLSAGITSGAIEFINLTNGSGTTSRAIALDVAGSEQTLREIAAFLEARANILLANMPNAQRRFARLKGQAASVSSPGSILMSYLPILVNGGTLSGSASLAQIEALAGNEQQARFDAWIDGTFGLFSNGGAEGRFGLVSLGADYLVTDDLLIGGFVQIDQLSQENSATAATAGGTGWMAGPYVTARLSDNLYLDLMAAGGQAGNRVSPLGTYEDQYGSTRFLASATLEGDWSHGAWTFAPVASVSWFSETSNAYTDSLGVAIPSTTVEQGQFAAGPGVRHHQDLGNGMTLTTSARFEAVAGYGNSLLSPWRTSIHGRASGGLDLGFAGGAALGFSLSHDGLFGAASRSTSVNIRLSAPLH